MPDEITPAESAPETSADSTGFARAVTILRKITRPCKCSNPLCGQKQAAEFLAELDAAPEQLAAPAVPVPPAAAQRIAADCVKIARLMGDRQNRDTTLTGPQCTKIVNALLSAGNLLSAAR